ncbi:hypothetical protein [Xanthobacter sp. KR7-225]|uniref:hypothetical protein n=1 Tax=Xanthobacter sp. KR7-225 TaxID=3156613 RepID=UPI0032B58A84
MTRARRSGQPHRFAFADRRGVIGFGNRMPAGVLHIADDPSHERLYEVVEVLARHAYDGETLLVPGIPEADNDDQALDALIAFRDQVAKRLTAEPRP